MRPTHWLHTIPLRLRSLFRSGAVERDLDDEMRFHLEMQVDQMMARGMAPDEARRAARRRFGGVEQKKEECRDMRHVRLVDELIRDTRFAIRGFAKAPGFTAAVLLTLTLGIGLNTGALSLTRFLRVMLYQVTPTDPGVIAVTCAAVLVGALAACVAPARTAARVDPIETLRAL